MAEKKKKNNNANNSQPKNTRAKKPAAKPTETEKKKRTRAQSAPAAKKPAAKKQTTHSEPKPPKALLNELGKLAQKHAGVSQPAPCQVPKSGAAKSGDTKTAQGNGKVKEITVKYRFD